MPALVFLGVPALIAAVAGWISSAAAVLIGAVSYFLAKKAAAITAYVVIVITAFVAWDALLTTVATNLAVPQQVLAPASWFLPSSMGAWITVWLAHQGIMLTLRIKSQALSQLN
jgi:hypothetical protein